LTSRLESELATHLRRRQEEELKFRDALKAELDYARTQVRQLLEGLASAKTEAPLKTASGELTARLNEQERAARELHATLSGAAAPTRPLRLEPGAQAHHLGLNAEVTIVEVTGDSAVVAAGVMKMRVPLSELGAPRGKAAPARFPGEKKKDAQLERAARLAPGAVETGGAKLDLRGQRAEDAVRELDLFLDRLSREGRDNAVVVHGHGTGALKASVREHLKRSPYVKSFRPGEDGEGGDGATVVTL
jgi:DNA mismatch repair protein MutS2